VGAQRGVQRLTLAEAAQLLGISKSAVRQRVRRGTLRSDKGEDGRVYVYLDTPTTNSQQLVSSQAPEASEAKANLEFERERRLEFWKIQYDYFKHLMTLALASIAGLGAMLGGVFSAFVGDPISEILIYAIFGCFVGVLLLSFEAMRGYRKRLNLLRKVVAEEDIKKLPHTVGPYLGWLGIFAFVLFAAGIFLFLAFVGVNLGLFGTQGV
jgi:magnesium-transporting ATPase (P-type)